jgi:excisionase family DNA binding protein
MVDEKVLLSVAETALLLGLDPKTVRKAAAAGEIPSVVIGRLIKVPSWFIRQQRDGAAPRAG